MDGHLPWDVDAWQWNGQLLVLFAALFAVHSAGAWIDLEARWRRLSLPMRAGRTLACLAAALFLRRDEPLDFVYFRS